MTGLSCDVACAVVFTTLYLAALGAQWVLTRVELAECRDDGCWCRGWR